MKKDPALIDYSEVTKIQDRSVTESLNILENENVVLVEAPTGSGKTRITARIIDELQNLHDQSSQDKSFRAINLTHRQLLAEQNEENFGKWAPNSTMKTCYACDGNLDQSERNVYALVQTIAHNREDLLPYDLISIDETHHASDAENGDFHLALTALLEKNPNAKILAVSATPSRPDKRHLSQYLKNAKRVTIGWKELEDAGQIKLPCTKELPIRTMNGIPIGEIAKDHFKPDRDANSDGLTKKLRDHRADDFLHQVANHWEIHSKGLRTIAYASRINDARAFKDEMLTRGYRVDVVDSSMSKEHNKDVLKKYADGQLDMVVSVKMIDEGLDVPATRCVLILRETTSEIEYSQMVGRALRTGDDPDLRDVQPIVLDAGASTMLHGSIERRAAIIDYIQRLQRGEASIGPNAQRIPPTLLANDKSEKSQREYSPWRRLRDKPIVLGFYDGKTVILAVQSVNAAGEPCYTIGQTTSISDKSRSKKIGDLNGFSIMKGNNNKPLFEVSGNILAEIEMEKLLPSRAALLRVEASMTIDNSKSKSIVDDKLSIADTDRVVDTLIAYHAKLKQYASR